MCMLLTPWVSLVLCWRTHILSFQLVHRVTPSFLTSSCGPRSSSQTQPPQFKVLCSQDLRRSCGSLSLCRSHSEVARNWGSESWPSSSSVGCASVASLYKPGIEVRGPGPGSEQGLCLGKEVGSLQRGFWAGKCCSGVGLWAGDNSDMATVQRRRREQGPHVECGRMQFGLQSRLSPSLLPSSLSQAP